MEVPVENSPLGVARCEAGCQLERKVDILLTGYVPGNQDRKGQEGECQLVNFSLSESKWSCNISETVLRISAEPCVNDGMFYIAQGRAQINE